MAGLLSAVDVEAEGCAEGEDKENEDAGCRGRIIEARGGCMFRRAVGSGEVVSEGVASLVLLGELSMPGAGVGEFAFDGAEFEGFLTWECGGVGGEHRGFALDSDVEGVEVEREPGKRAVK